MGRSYNPFYGALCPFGSWSILLLYGKECHEHLSKSLNLCSADLKIHEQNRNAIFQSTIPFYCMFCCVIGDHCHTPRASDVIWAHYAIIILCSLQWKSPALLCLHVKVFLPAFCAAFIPLLLTEALIAAWGTVTQKCTHAAFTDLWPCQLRTNLEIRNREWKREERGEKEMPASWTGFEEAFLKDAILVTSFWSEAR